MILKHSTVVLHPLPLMVVLTWPHPPLLEKDFVKIIIISNVTPAAILISGPILCPTVAVAAMKIMERYQRYHQPQQRQHQQQRPWQRSKLRHQLIT